METMETMDACLRVSICMAVNKNINLYSYNFETMFTDQLERGHVALPPEKLPEVGTQPRQQVVAVHDDVNTTIDTGAEPS